MTTMSERTLSAAFVQGVDSSARDCGLPKFGVLLPEFEARQGRADYVGVQCSAASFRRAGSAGWGRVLTRPAAASVFAALGFAPRTPAFLAIATGFTLATVRACVAELAASGLLKITSTGSVVRRHAALPQPEVWAFEIKLAGWRRALFQATQYQAFAHRSAVVLAAEFAHRALAHRDLFRTLGVGLWSVDCRELSVERLVAPRRREPSSHAYHWHAVGRIIDLARAGYAA